MSVHQSASFRAALTPIDADRALKFGVGMAVAPLWAAYMGAASAGVAFWWMTAWTRQTPKPILPTIPGTILPTPIVKAIVAVTPEPVVLAPTPVATLELGVETPEPAAAVGTHAEVVSEVEPAMIAESTASVPTQVAEPAPTVMQASSASEPVAADTAPLHLVAGDPPPPIAPRSIPRGKSKPKAR